MNRREIQRRLERRERFEPPDDLLARIRADVPRDLFPHRGEDQAQSAGDPTPRRGDAWLGSRLRVLSLAASLLLVVFAGIVAVRFEHERRTGGVAFAPVSFVPPPEAAQTDAGQAKVRSASPGQDPASEEEPPMSRREAAPPAAASFRSEIGQAGISQTITSRDDTSRDDSSQDMFRAPAENSVEALATASAMPSMTNELPAPAPDAREGATSPSESIAERAPTQPPPAVSPELDAHGQVGDVSESQARSAPEKMLAAVPPPPDAAASVSGARERQLAPAEQAKAAPSAGNPERAGRRLEQRGEPAEKKSPSTSEPVARRAAASAEPAAALSDATADEREQSGLLAPLAIRWIRGKLEVSGRVEPGSRVEVDGEAIELDSAGRFRVRVERDRWPAELELRLVTPDGVEQRHRLAVPEREPN